jgi:hypothetical protein
MRRPDRRKPRGRTEAFGYFNAEADNLDKQYSTRLHFRTPWLPTVCRSLMVAQQPCPLTRSIAVHDLCREMREALR